jgi:transcriptional regulator with XRE-family HTH domain
MRPAERTPIVPRLLDIQQVATYTGLKIEAGRLDPQLSTLLKLCQALRVSLSQLVGETNKKGGA